jgi:L-fuconolactonase
VSGRLDAHVHLWDLDSHEHAWLRDEAMAPIRVDRSLADLRDVATSVEVSSVVLVQTAPSSRETQELMQTARVAPELVHGVVGWVDLTAVDVADQLAALTGGPDGELLVGVRHVAQDEPDPEWLGRPDVRRGIRAIAEAGLAYDVLIRPPQWAAAVRLAREEPGTRLVLDHAGKPPLTTPEELDPWREFITAFAEVPGTVVKLSGLVTEADWDHWQPRQLYPVAETVLDAFGPARVMAGSDWPVCTLAASYHEVWMCVREFTAALSAAERSDVEGGTARRIYRR